MKKMNEAIIQYETTRIQHHIEFVLSAIPGTLFDRDDIRVAFDTLRFGAQTISLCMGQILIEATDDT